MPSFFEGDYVFGKFSRPGAGEFITRFMALPRDRRRLLRVVMNHARLGSLGPHLFLYDIVDHLVRALDALCRGHGLMQQNLCAGLTTAAQDAVKNTTVDTTSRLRQLADGASQAGNLSDYRVFTTAGRVISSLFAVTIAVGYLPRMQANESSSQPWSGWRAGPPFAPPS